jgi:hypothetical protein
MNLDVAWLLYTSKRLAEGADLYKDIIEINPPLAVYINLPAVYFAKALGLSEIPIFYGLLLLLISFSLYWCWNLLNALFSQDSREDCSFTFLYLAFLLSMLPAIFDPPYMLFGQREHIMLILTLPYILTAALRSMGKPLDSRSVFLTGLLAGVGFSLKPHFFLVWAGIEAYLAFLEGKLIVWRRPENLAIFVVVLGYLFFLVIFESDYFNIVYFATKLYSGFDCSWRDILLNFMFFSCILSSLIALFIIVEKKSILSHIKSSTLIVLLITSSAFLISALLQKKGWNNHLFPGFVINLLILSMFISYTPKSYRTSGPLFIFLKVLKITIVVFLIIIPLRIGLVTVHYQKKHHESLLNRMVPLVNEHAPGKAIYFLSTFFYPAFPLVNYTGGQWSGRFNALWPIPGIYRSKKQPVNHPFYHTPENMDGVEKWFFEIVISDLTNHPPTLLVVDRAQKKRYLGDRKFDFIEYFAQDARFSDCFSRYKLIDQIGHLHVYKRTQ